MTSKPSKPSFPAKFDLSVGKGVLAYPLQPKSVNLSATIGKSSSNQLLGLRSAKSVNTVTPATMPQGMGMDSQAVRANMVRKLEKQGIQDVRVLAAMNATHRHQFVDTALANQAYEDTSLRGLHAKAQNNVRQFRFKNVHLLFGDGMLGYAKGAPYTGIIAAAGGEAIPQAWIDQLAVGGRIVAPVVNSAQGEQSLVVIDKTNSGIKRLTLELVQFVPLKSGLG